MSRLIDLVGARFGRLRVVARAGMDSTGKTTWRCECDCGGHAVATGLNLRSGNTKTCGCGKHLRGAENPRTITDPARLRERKRSIAVLRHWRRGVLARDGGCARCGSADDLQAHHIVGYADAPHLRASADNGVALCGACHGEFHAMYGRRGATEADLAEWLVGIHERPPIVGVETVLDGDAAAVVECLAVGDLQKAQHYLAKLIEVETAKAEIANLGEMAVYGEGMPK